MILLTLDRVLWGQLLEWALSHIFVEHFGRVRAWIQDDAILFPSPLQATVLPSIGPKCSSKAITSAKSWQGCELLVRPLMTGTVANSAISAIFSRSNVLIIIQSTYRERTRAVSAILSPRPVCSSALFRTTTSPQVVSYPLQMKRGYAWTVFQISLLRPFLQGVGLGPPFHPSVPLHDLLWILVHWR